MANISFNLKSAKDFLDEPVAGIKYITTQVKGAVRSALNNSPLKIKFESKASRASQSASSNPSSQFEPFDSRQPLWKSLQLFSSSEYWKRLGMEEKGTWGGGRSVSPNDL